MSLERIREIARKAKDGFGALGLSVESAMQRDLNIFVRPEQIATLKAGDSVSVNWPDDKIGVGDRVLVKTHQDRKSEALQCVVSKVFPGNRNAKQIELKLQRKDQ